MTQRHTLETIIRYALEGNGRSYGGGLADYGDDAIRDAIEHVQRYRSLERDIDDVQTVVAALNRELAARGSDDEVVATLIHEADETPEEELGRLRRELSELDHETPEYRDVLERIAVLVREAAERRREERRHLPAMSETSTNPLEASIARSRRVTVEMEEADLAEIADALETLAGIDEGEHVDDDRLRSLAARLRETVDPDGTVRDAFGNTVGIDQPAAAAQIRASRDAAHLMEETDESLLAMIEAPVGEVSETTRELARLERDSRLRERGWTLTDEGSSDA